MVKGETLCDVQDDWVQVEVAGEDEAEEDEEERFGRFLCISWVNSEVSDFPMMDGQDLYDLTSSYLMAVGPLLNLLNCVGVRNSKDEGGENKNSSAAFFFLPCFLVGG